LNSDSSSTDEKSQQNNSDFSNATKLRLIKESVDKFLEFIKINGFIILKKNSKESHYISKTEEKLVKENEEAKENNNKINFNNHFNINNNYLKERELEDHFNKNGNLIHNNYKIDNIDVNKINCQNNFNYKIANNNNHIENGFISNFQTLNNIYFNNYNNINDNSNSNFVNNLNKNYKEDYLDMNNRDCIGNKFKYKDNFKDKVSYYLN